MVRSIRERRIVITGASSGIGRSLGQLAAKRGAQLLLVARSEDRLDELAASLRAGGAKVIALAADVTSAVDRQMILETAVSHLGGLDLLINNAGVASFGHFADSSEAVMRQVMEVNFFAPAELMRLAVPVLREGREPAVVNIASMCGRRGLPAWPEYSASKYALCGLTEALRAEFARFEIDVLLILPGLTKTDLGSNLLRHEGRMKIDFTDGMAPEVVAQSILEALEKNRAETIVGREARWLLRINRIFPGLVDRLIARKVRKLYATSPPDGG